MNLLTKLVLTSTNQTKIMIREKNNNQKEEQHPVDAYYECLSYCDINPKGIDQDCESICIERHLKGNLW